MKPAAVALSTSPYLAVGAGAVGLHAFGSQVPWSELANTYLEPRFWLTLAVIAACGAVGGVVYELVRWRGIIELPHRVGCAEMNESNPDAPTSAMIDLGVVGRAISGATAAVAIQWIVPPGNAEATLAVAVTAGLTASPLIRTLRRQIVALANWQKKSRKPTHRSRRAATDGEAGPVSNVRDFQLERVKAESSGTPAIK